MVTRRKQVAIYAVLAMALIIGAFFIANYNRVPSASREWAGICVHALSPNDARIVNESGAGWIRIDASPDDFETAVENARAFNLSVLGILDSWMFNKSPVFTLEEWRSNVTYYVSQYADSVDAWEIWNEPANPTYPLLNLNTSSQANMSRISEFYFSMVQIASPIIRQYDPSAKILLFGGLNLNSGDAQNLKFDREFAQQLANMNIQQYGDVISIHAYPWTTQAQQGIWGSYNKSLEYYRGLFANKSVEFWVTETGQTTEGGEKGQAQYMANALGYFNGKVSRVFWYSLLDNPWEGNQTFGLVDSNGTLRPAYFELQKQLTD